jgi:uncharacterized protein (DUF58 family)
MRWPVVAILILLVALALGLSMLAYAMYVLLAVILISRYLTGRWSEGLTAVREVNRLEAEVGDRVAIVITVENRGKLPIPWLLVEDLLPLQALIHQPPNLQVTGRRVLLTTLRPGGTKRLMYQLLCHRRGYYQLGPLVMEAGDLFGLHRRYRVASSPHFLMVYPRSIPLSGYEIASRRPIGEVRMTYRLYEDPTRNAGVRRYEAGDPLNRVHWPATARTGVLQSKVYEPSTVAGATIVLDFHADSYPRHNEPFRSELAVTAAASLAQAVFEMGQQVGLVTNGRDAADRVRQEGWSYDIRTRDAAHRAASMLPRSERLRPQLIETRRGAEQLMRIRETLARVELTDGLNFVELVAETACRLPRDATVVAILQKVSDEFAIALGNLRRQGFAVTAILSVHESYDFAEASRHFLAEGITTHQLRDEDSVAEIARAQLTAQLLRTTG